MMRAVLIGVCLALLVMILHVMGLGTVDALPNIVRRGPLAGQAGSEFECLMTDLRHASTMNWVGNEKLTLKGDDVLGLLESLTYEGHWVVAKIAGDTANDRNVFIETVAEQRQVSAMGSSTSSGPLVGRAWATDGDNAVLYGPDRGSGERNALRGVERRLRNPNLFDLVEGQSVGERRRVEGDAASHIAAQLLNVAEDHLRATVLEVALVSIGEGGDWQKIVIEGDTRLELSEVGWFEVAFEGTVQWRDAGTPRKTIKSKYRGRCASTTRTGTVMTVSGALINQLIVICEAGAQPEHSDLDGMWERTGDELEGMRIRFRQVGGTWYGFIDRLPARLEDEGWRYGQIKMLPTESAKGRFEMLSLTLAGDGANPAYSKGTALFRDDGVLVWSAGEATGAIGDRQYWKRMADDDNK